MFQMFKDVFAPATATTTRTETVEIVQPVVTYATTSATVETAAPTIDHVERPTLVEERAHRKEVEVVQPVIHREREQREVHQVIENIYERQVKPTVVREQQLASEYRPDVRVITPEEEREYMNVQVTGLRTTIEHAPIEHERVVKEPIVLETIKKKIIEVIQPVIHRETFETEVTYSTQPIYEKVVEEPVIVRETITRQAPTVETTTTTTVIDRDYATSGPGVVVPVATYTETRD